MQNKIRVAQMSDLHYSAGNLKESDACFSAAVTSAIQNGVDAAIITGDSTDHGLDAHSPAFHALQKQVQRLANHCPVLMLQGTFSHEPAGFLRNLAMIGTKFPIAVADKISSWDLTDQGFKPHQIDAQSSLVIRALPTLNKADIAALVDDAVDEASIQTRAIIANVIRSWAAPNQELRAKGTPVMMLSHGTVMNSVSEHGVPMAGADHELAIGTLFDGLFDAVALGHIHKQQEWHDTSNGFEQWVAYAGSIGRFHYGEEGDKNWLLWSMTAGATTFEKHATPSRRTVDLEYEGAPDMDDIRAKADGLVGAYVRLRYCVDEEMKHIVDRKAIRQILERCEEVQIEGVTLIVSRQRAKDISTKSLPEKLALWGQTTNTSDADMAALGERLELIQTQDDQAIISQIVAS